MTDNLPDLNRLSPFVSGLGKTILQELIEDMAAIERQSVPAGWKLVPIEPSDEWIARLESQQTGALEAVDADAIRQCIAELLAAAPQPQPVQEVEHCLWARNGNSRCPVPQAAQPLSDEQIREVINASGMMFTAPDIKVARAIDQAHGIKKGTT